MFTFWGRGAAVAASKVAATAGVVALLLVGCDGGSPQENAQRDFYRLASEGRYEAAARSLLPDATVQKAWLLDEIVAAMKRVGTRIEACGGIESVEISEQRQEYEQWHAVATVTLRDDSCKPMRDEWTLIRGGDGRWTVNSL